MSGVVTSGRLGGGSTIARTVAHGLGHGLFGNLGRPEDGTLNHPACVGDVDMDNLMAQPGPFNCGTVARFRTKLVAQQCQQAVDFLLSEEGQPFVIR